MNTDIANAVNATDTDAQYDQNAKRLLGNKKILAHILIRTVEEFKGMSAEEAATYIEGEPYIGIVPVEPGVTNAPKTDQDTGDRVIGFNTENSEVNEGLARFDIIFYVRMKNGLSQMIVNVEAQKSEPTAYDIINRTIFYVSRVISSQKERDFRQSNYNDIKEVYSIWICMGIEECCLNHIHLTNDTLLGNHDWKGNMDLFNVLMIGLTEEIPEQGKEYELHRLLSTLLSQELSKEQKLNIIETEYSIKVDDGLSEVIGTMCNLSQGILEKGEARGEARGIEIGEVKGEASMIVKMHEAGYDNAEIARVSGHTEEEVANIIKKYQPVLV